MGKYFLSKKLGMERLLTPSLHCNLKLVIIHQFIENIVGWEPEGRYCSSEMFHWEPEGCYCHRLCTAIAPFWFSMEHLCSAITPFWHSTDDMFQVYCWGFVIHLLVTGIHICTSHTLFNKLFTYSFSVCPGEALPMDASEMSNVGVISGLETTFDPPLKVEIPWRPDVLDTDRVDLRSPPPPPIPAPKVPTPPPPKGEHMFWDYQIKLRLGLDLI